jgi:hypothetical protein
MLPAYHIAAYIYAFQEEVIPEFILPGIGTGLVYRFNSNIWNVVDAINMTTIWKENFRHSDMGTKLYNKIPGYIKEIESYTAFKKVLQ